MALWKVPSASLTIVLAIWQSPTYRPAGQAILVAVNRSADYALTSVEHGVRFDLADEGTPRQVSWTAPGSGVAFLAIDHDKDGKITSGRELLGDRTLPGEAEHGFWALSTLSFKATGGLRLGSVSEENPLFATLLLWTDSNHNGLSEPVELRLASELVTDVGLGYHRNGKADAFGNVFTFRGWVHVRTAPGRNEVASPQENSERTRPIWNVVLRTNARQPA